MPVSTEIQWYSQQTPCVLNRQNPISSHAVATGQSHNRKVSESGWEPVPNPTDEPGCFQDSEFAENFYFGSGSTIPTTYCVYWDNHTLTVVNSYCEPVRTAKPRHATATGTN